MKKLFLAFVIAVTAVASFAIANDDDETLVIKLKNGMIRAFYTSEIDRVSVSEYKLSEDYYVDTDETIDDNVHSTTWSDTCIVFNGKEFVLSNTHKILIHFFAGWNCVNSPTLNNLLHSQVLNTYPSQMVEFHMASNAFSANQRDGFSCKQADSIVDIINGNSYYTSQLPLPAVTVDNYSTNGELFSSSITDILKNVKERYNQCNIDHVAPEVGIATRIEQASNTEYEITTLVYYPERRGQLNIKLWLAEDNLVSSRQYSSDGYIKDYCSGNPIFRHTINGSCYGENITMNNDGWVAVSHIIDFSEKEYIIENCRVIASVYDDEGIVLNSNITSF